MTRVNAWHHQKERHMFASLMQSICERAIPSFFTRSGLRFYRRLVSRRLLRHPFWTALLLIPAVLCVVLVVRDDWIIDTIGLIGFDILDSLEGNANVVLSVTLFLVSFPFSAWKAFVPDLKRVKPGYLIAAATKADRPKTFGGQLGFRHRFQEALREVVEAMKPYRLVITIDDLDRCRPEQVVDTLEAINFLADAGQCYVVMGIAREQVIRCVGLRFKEIAQEVSFVSSDDDSKSGSNDDTERLKRADFARQYLEKIINLEVKIPKVSKGDMTAFIRRLRHRSSEPAKTGGELGALGRVTMFITYVVVVIALLLAALVFVFGSLISPLTTADKPLELVVSVNDGRGPPEDYTVHLDSRSSNSLTIAVTRPVSEPESSTVPTLSPLVEISKTQVDVREGSSEDYTVVLTEQPALPVMITAARSEGDPDLSVTVGAVLTFTAENWSDAQSVTISATEDADSDDDVATIEHSVESEDLRFHESQVRSVRATERDNDSPPPPPPPPPTPSTSVPPATWLATLIAISVLVFVTRAYLSRPEEDHSRDSPEFERALEIWHPVVRARTDSPRQFKRFVNRVRFLAALSRSKWQTEDPRTVPGDSLMVALAALQSVRHEAESPDTEEPIPLHVVAGLSDERPLSEDADSDFRKWVHGNIRQVALQLPSQGRQAFCDRVLEELKKAIDAHQSAGEEATEEKIIHYNTVAGLV
ncbi:MAG: P-loop NTPase fold protein [Chloroflexota bacterium]|nr:P-loop NTPase fold protein [Chloroflexota bacterium]